MDLCFFSSYKDAFLYVFAISGYCAPSLVLSSDCDNGINYLLPMNDDCPDGTSACSDMDLNDLHPPDDYTHRFFIWHEWIQVGNFSIYCLCTHKAQANGPLSAENVFDYFATSMFYDKQSNNQVLRMQTIHTGIPIANEAEELR